MSRKCKLIIGSLIIMCSVLNINSRGKVIPLVQNNKAPLTNNPYIELPIGSIKPKGMLLEMLNRQRTGLTSQIDVLYPSVMGSRNGWLGGDGDQWERGPYWIDGLVPLAYILNDENLKKKAQPWIEWALKSQREDGFFGPSKDYSFEKGLQRKNSEDWWPRIVVLKFLKQYYSATSDKRVIDFMSRYFYYQLKTLPHKPLGNWTFWAEYRAGDNLQIVYWLYNITGENYLLELANILHKQSKNYTNMFLFSNTLSEMNSIHGVNLSQGIKEPIIFYQQEKDNKYIDAVKKAFVDIRKFHGQPQGMFGADESIHGNNPTQGSELCTAVELMFSLEEMSKITGDIEFLDHLERIAFNTLPTQITDDFMARQYFQQPNQVMITKATRNFDINHEGTDLVFGLLTGYPCCTSNMHQAWPKFTQNLWYSTSDNGIAALVFSASEVDAKVSNGVKINMKEETHYPMDDKLYFTLKILDKRVNEVKFPFHLRIPGWCKFGRISINGNLYKDSLSNEIVIVDRIWKSGDIVELSLPMKIQISKWYENSVTVERGPLVYALKIDERWEKKNFDDPQSIYGQTYYEVFPQSKWNYGLMDFDLSNPDKAFEIVVDSNKVKSTYPWNLNNAPIAIKAKAKEIPIWSLYNQSAGPLPYSNVIYGLETNNLPIETITLIPYGCTTLRITEFPVIQKY